MTVWTCMLSVCAVRKGKGVGEREEGEAPEFPILAAGKVASNVGLGRSLRFEHLYATDNDM